MNKIDSFFGEYRWLSNFHVHPIVYEGLRYGSTEAAYQAAKCLHPEQRLDFINLSPRDAKHYGSQVEMIPNWNEIKYGVMMDVVSLKFNDPYLQKLLIATSPLELIEGNTWGDTYWGVCNGKGQNKLGEILMIIRHRLITDQMIIT